MHLEDRLKTVRGDRMHPLPPLPSVHRQPQASVQPCKGVLTPGTSGFLAEPERKAAPPGHPPMPAGHAHPGSRPRIPAHS